MELLLAGIIGLVVGSFLNVCIYRIPKGESVSYPPSHCGSCNHKLSSIDLMPILSYVLLKGRCRYCRKSISPQYPLIESLNSILYMLIYMKYGHSIISIKFFIFASLVIVIGMIDYKTQDVYTSTTVFGTIFGIIFVILQIVIFKEGSSDLIAGCLIGSAIIGAIVFLTRGMGEGDIEIAGLCGLFLGTRLILLDLFIAVIIGGIAGIIILALKLKDRKDSIAFGPCIAIGALISMLFGNEIINMYLKMFF